MKRNLPGLIIITCQVVIVGLFFTTVFNDDIKVERYVSTIHNSNLNKIANSVSLLFEQEDEERQLEDKTEDLATLELPSITPEPEETKKEEPVVKEEDKPVSEPLVSVDAR